MSFATLPNGTSPIPLIQAFFELAQANRDKSASGGARIGESGFDQRMQASRRMLIRLYGLTSRFVDTEGEDVFMLKNFSKAEDDDDETKLVDPVRWYGLLASQSLKDAQSRFVKGISGARSG